ncbi:MAG: DUF1634 domain-containing protein [Candidatus Sulfotelmatobacter sp.]|jgi:uncharacterized membrane protein
MGGLLRAGVLGSAVVVFVGAIIFLAGNARSPANYRVFKGEPADLRTVGGVLRDGIALRGTGIMQLGLLLLIATPVARVAFSIFGFLKERDHLYAAVAAIVFVILLYSLFFS